jgi:hypothetical protein
MYWTLNVEGKIWFHRYEYDAEKHIEYSRVKIDKYGSVEPFGLHPDLKYWLSGVTSDCSTDRECMCHEDMNSIYHYVKTRLDMDKERETLKILINSGEFDQFISVCE